MLKNKYNDLNHTVFVMNLLFYNSGTEFINDLLIDIDNNMDLSFDRKLEVISDILEYGFNTKKIIVKNITTSKIFNEKNLDELIDIIKKNYSLFFDIKYSGKYYYNFGIYYTEFWDAELVKIGAKK